MRCLWVAIGLSLVLAGPSQAAEPCRDVAGAMALWKARETRYVLFGEMHGTAEAPALFGDVVCLASGERPVIVALEMPATEQAALDLFMASDGSSKDLAALLAGAFWSAKSHDGRSSEAMLSLIGRLRELKAAGRPLKVLAFVPEYPSGFHQDYYELDMALALTVAGRASPDALVLVLVGNFHAGRRTDFGIMPAALHLPDAETVVLDLVVAGGEAWNCQKDGCGPHRLGGDPETKRGVIMFDASRDGFDGSYGPGTSATASPPARP